MKYNLLITMNYLYLAKIILIIKCFKIRRKWWNQKVMWETLFLQSLYFSMMYNWKIILSMLKSLINLVFVDADWFSRLLITCSLMQQQKPPKNHCKFKSPISVLDDIEQAFIILLTWKWQLKATENDKLSVL